MYAIMVDNGNGWELFSTEVYQCPVGLASASTAVSFLNVGEIFEHRVVKLEVVNETN